MIKFSSPYPADGFKGTESYEGLRLEVMSQLEAMQYVPGDDEVCISISSAGYGIRYPELSDKFVEIMRLEFDDTAVGDVDNPDAKTISSEQATELAQFVVRNKNRKKMVIHCFAGISRSRSTAAAIVQTLELPYKFTVLNQSVWRAVSFAIAREISPQWEDWRQERKKWA